MNKCLIFDLDNTLINTKKRHFSILIDFLSSKQVPKKGIIDFQDYCKLRYHQSFSNYQTIESLQLCNTDKSEFSKFFLNRIESPEYLTYDEEIVNSKLLSEIKLKFAPIFFLSLSLRSNINTAEKQFSSFSFSSLFDNHYFLTHDENCNPKKKFLHDIVRLYDILFFVGDTYTDQQAAIAFNIPFIGIAGGFYKLEATKFNDVNSFLNFLLEKDHLYEL